MINTVIFDIGGVLVELGMHTIRFKSLEQAQEELDALL